MIDVIKNVSVDEFTTMCKECKVSIYFSTACFLVLEQRRLLHSE